MINPQEVAVLLSVTQQLSAEYKQYMAKEKSTSQAVVADKADMKYLKKNGHSFNTDAQKKIRTSEWGRAYQKYLTDSKKEQRFSGTVRMLAANLKVATVRQHVAENVAEKRHITLDVDSIAEVTEQTLQRSGIDKVKSLNKKEQPLNLKVIYAEDDNRNAVHGKIDGMDIAATVDYLNGHSLSDTIPQVINDEDRRITPAVAGYLALKAKDRNTSVAALKVSDIKHDLLQDAKQMRVQVTDLDDSKALTKRELLSAYEDVYDLNQSKPISDQSTTESIARLQHIVKIQDHQKKIDDPKAMKQEIKLIANQNGFNKEINKLDNHLIAMEKPKSFSHKKEVDSNQELDGGRRLGESRPGAGLHH